MSSVKRGRIVRRRKKKDPVIPKPTGTTASTQYSRLGSLVARGVKTLASVLPGSQLIAPLADFVLNQIAFSNINGSTVGQTTFSGNALVYGAQARIIISRPNLVATSPTVQLQKGGHNENFFYHEYRDVRVKSLTITVQPDAQLAKRAGTLYLGFTPFEDKQQAFEEANNSSTLTQDYMKKCLKGVYGPFGKPLSLTYRPKAFDGLAYAFCGISDAKEKVTWDSDLTLYRQPTRYGVLCILYENLCRDGYTDLLPSELAFNVVLNADMEFRRPLNISAIPLSTDVNTDYAHLDKYENPLKGSALTLVSENRVHCVSLSTVGFKSVPDATGKTLKITGIPLHSVESSPKSQDFEML